jgi:hypothetical protein
MGDYAHKQKDPLYKTPLPACWTHCTSEALTSLSETRLRHLLSVFYLVTSLVTLKPLVYRSNLFVTSIYFLWPKYTTQPIQVTLKMTVIKCSSVQMRVDGSVKIQLT